MIDFQPLSLEQKPKFDQILQNATARGCEYSFANLFIWGRQRAAFLGDTLMMFSQFNRTSVYPFPVGDRVEEALEAIIRDAKLRDIPCRITSLSQEECEKLERLYPGRFRFHFDRDFFDYVYDINDLADLKGKKYQKKRNHLNRFLQTHPGYCVEPITSENEAVVMELAMAWYDKKQAEDPTSDTHMEKAAFKKAMTNREALGMEGLLLYHEGQPIAMTMGNFLRQDTFDVNFEKAIDPAAYPVINWEFARYLRQKYPDLQYLDREEDMGIEGLRKAKLSYYPHHMVEKHWACLLEDGYDY